MAEILVVGSINIDLVVRAPHFPAPGETIQGEELAILPGGKGANQAVAAARLGGKVRLLGRVGNDSFGSTLLASLEQNHVDASLVIRDEATATGSAVIVVDANGQNSIVVSPGANGKVRTADIPPAALGDARLLILQFEIPVETVLHSARLARQHGLCVLLDPAPAQSIPDELLANTDYLVPNETELSLLTGQPVLDLESTKAAAHRLLERGAKSIIVTLGENGALMVNRERSIHIPSFRIEAVDTTAAGDAFIGGLAISLLKGKSPEDSVRYACACGALAATKFGAQTSLPTAVEVERFMKLQSGNQQGRG